MGNLEMNRDGARAIGPHAFKSDANFEDRFGGAIRTARIDAGELHRRADAAVGCNGTNRQHEALRGKEHDRGVAVLMLGGTLRVIVMMAGVLRAVVMMMADLQVPGERIGEMNVMVRVLDTIHERNIGLAGKDDRERHADHGDHTPETDRMLPAQPSLVRMREPAQPNMFEGPGNARNLALRPRRWLKNSFASAA
jgi:hypothetical protein